MIYTAIVAQIAPVTPVLAEESAKLVIDGLSAGCTVIIAIFTAFAAWQAFRTVKEAARSATTAQFQARKHATIEYLSAVRSDYLELDKGTRELMAEGIVPDPDLVWKMKTGEQDKGEPTKKRQLTHKLTHLLSIWEHLSAGVNSGVFDAEIVNDMVGPRLLDNYSRYAPFIRHQRRKDLGNYDQLELLIDRLYAMRRSAYVITRKTLARLKANFVSPRTIRELTRLRNRVFKNYQELCKELVEHELHTEKHLITALSRQAAYSVIPYTAGLKRQVEELCKVVCKDLNCEWPGSIRESKNNLKEWEKKLMDWIHETLSTFKCYCVIQKTEVPRKWGGWTYKFDSERQVVGFIALQGLPKDESAIIHWKDAFAPMGSTHPLDEIVLIRRIFVLPGQEWRKKGIGTMLLRHAIRVIQEGESAPDENRGAPDKAESAGKKLPAAEIPSTRAEAVKLITNQGGILVNKYQRDNDMMGLYIL